MGRKNVECALDKRNQEILTAIIKLHIATGEPVGSRTLSKQPGQALSPASIRNIMADLEESGYLTQPHASAGRVPTDKGYRFYVDNLVADFDSRLPRSDEEIIHRGLFADAEATQEDIMGRASHLLSQISTHVGIVLSPPLSQDILQHIEFLRLADRRILVIMVSRTGLVRDVIVRIDDEDLTQDELNRTARYISESFRNHSLTSIRIELLRRMSEEKALYDRLLKNAILLCGQSLKDQAENANVYVDGAINILNQADFADTERMKAIFRMFEEKGRLVKILNQCLTETHNGVVVHIGAESRVPGLRDCAIVTSPYLYRDQVMGSVSVVGPMRMKYARIMRVVGHVARLFEQSLGDQEMRDAFHGAPSALSAENAQPGSLVLSAD